MELKILATLANWGDTPGWELWAGEEGIAEQLKLDKDYRGRDYAQFKRVLGRLASATYIMQTNADEKRAAKAVWVITEAGQAHWVQSGRKQSTDVSSYIGKRITADAPLPREVYRELMTKHRAGEIDLAFLVLKNKK